MLLVQAKIFVIKCLIQECNNATRVGVEPDHAIMIAVKALIPSPPQPRCRFEIHSSFGSNSYSTSGVARNFYWGGAK